MGCQQSKIEDAEAVMRCKERKQLMKAAVSARNAFAAAHAAYVIALKQTGSALSDYGQSEMGQHPPASSAVGPSASSSASVSAMPQAPLPPPPPPLPNFSPSPLMRSASMPDLPIPKPRRKKDSTATITEEDDVPEMEDEEDRGGDGGVGPSTSSPVPPPPPLPPRDQPTSPPPPTPPSQQTDWDYFFSAQHPSLTETHQKILRERVDDNFKRSSSSTSASDVPAHASGSSGEVNPPVNPEKAAMDTPPKHQRRSKQGGGGSSHHQHTASAGVSEIKRGKPVSSSSAPINLVQMLTDLDEHFLRASESAAPVTRMLETIRLHYHSNFADNRGHIDHSAKVMQVITWNRSFKGLPNNDDGNDDFDNEELETHATILDKLLAWEKKLYDEVKEGEIMKIKYQKKVALLNKQKKHGANPNTLETTKAAVSHLHTRYIVDIQSMDSTVSEIQRLRDHQLYPKLASLVDGMAAMWETMHTHHDSQLKIVMDIKSLDISSSPKETTQKHHELTVQLYNMAKEWHSEFQKLVIHQKEYIQALSGWLRLNVIPVEKNLKEKVSSPPMVLQPPIQALVYAWQDQLGKLSDDIALHAVSSFAAVINAIIAQQQEELKQKDKCYAVRKEYHKRNMIYTDWLDKYNSRRPADEADQEGADNANQNDEMVQRQLEVELLQKKVEEEEEIYQNLCKQMREKAVGSLKMHMPELFRAISDFAQACSKMCKYLRSIPPEK